MSKSQPTGVQSRAQEKFARLIAVLRSDPEVHVSALCERFGMPKRTVIECARRAGLRVVGGAPPP